MELHHLDSCFVANSIAAFGPGDTRKNLQLAISGETFEIDVMNPVIIQVAAFQGEKGAKGLFEWSYVSEKTHKKCSKKGMRPVGDKQDMELDRIQVCNVCGFTLAGVAPDICPVCSAQKDKFEEFS